MITKEHIELLEEMIAFPQVYRLTDHGLETIKDLLEQIKPLVEE